MHIVSNFHIVWTRYMAHPVLVAGWIIICRIREKENVVYGTVIILVR